MYKLGVVILNWNSYEGTKKCIDSILPYKNNNSSNLEIFVIDNDSPDKSGDKLASEYLTNVMFFNTGRNGGYTGGNNFGITKALERECDCVLILNNDVEISNFHLVCESIESVFRALPKTGVIGFDIFNLETRRRLGSVGVSDRVFNQILGFKEHKMNLDRNISLASQRSVCGCAICIRTKCIEEIGMFDEEFFMYAEEHDLCLRANNSGWDAVKIENKKARIYRKIDLPSESQLIWYYEARNIFRAYGKSLHGVRLFLICGVQMLIYFRQMIRYSFKKEYKISLKIATGMFHAWKYNKSTNKGSKG